MKIGIDAQRIFRADKHGMDVVALELLRRLQTTDTTNQYCLFAAKGRDMACLTASSNLQVKILPSFTYADWEQLSLPSAIKKYTPDIIHCTANTAPLDCAVPLILTLHDIIYLEQKASGGSVYQNIGNLYRRWVVPPAIKKAVHIITVSDYERRIIAEKFPETASKLSVIYNGVDERFNNKYVKEDLEAFRTEMGLPADFILFLGNTAPKKNTDNVVKAYVQYCEMEKDPLPIVITDYDRKYVERILSAVNKPKLIHSFVFPGHVAFDKMPLLYNCAALFLYPSLRESFGLPILEAMACGVPVITSNTSAMPEVAGAAAILIDPQNCQALAENIRQLLNDESLRTSCSQKGLSRASHFSWDNGAEKLLSIYLDHQH